ncbi:MAG TPA: hypothetical protein VG457_02655 [Planctomycetota bacterium]|nr:hypothetical protein [Planctomycetota bacterium]
MRSLWKARWPGSLPKLSRQRASALLAAILSVVLFGVNPRSVSALRPEGTRCRDSRRPKPPRHILTASIFRVARVARNPRQPANPGAPESRVGDDGAKFSFCTRTLLPPRVTSELTKPDYLKLFSAAQQQSSLPC